MRGIRALVGDTITDPRAKPNPCRRRLPIEAAEQRVNHAIKQKVRTR
jgi:hypothetical protein